MTKKTKDLAVVAGVCVGISAGMIWLTNNNDKVNKALGKGGILGWVTRLTN